MRELEGITAILAVPTYGPVDPKYSIAVRAAMMSASNRGLRWSGDASPDRMDFATARNTVAQQAMDADADGVIWVDSDIEPEPLSIARLVNSAKDLDFVTGVYHKRGWPHEPVMYHYNPDLKRFFVIEGYPENSFLKIGGCGFGFVWTSTKMIRAIAEHKDFSKKRGWFPDDRHSGGFGEDMSFCYAANNAGFNLFVDTGIQVGHDGIWRKDYLKAWEEVKKMG